MALKRIRSKRINKTPDAVDPMLQLLYEGAVMWFKQKPSKATEDYLRYYLKEMGYSIDGADKFIHNLSKKGKIINLR